MTPLPAPSPVAPSFASPAGHIQLILGPMFSGKTTELVRRLKRYQHARLRCLVVKYKADTRYSDDCVATHDKQMIDAKPCTRLAEVASL